MNDALRVGLSPLRGIFFLAMVIGNIFLVSIIAIVTFAVLLALFTWDLFFETFFNSGWGDDE